MILKNQRHEAVAQAYVLDPHKVGWKAYKFVYPKASQRSAEVQFSQFLKNLEFSARIAELQGEVAKTVEITLESLIGEAADIQKAAFDDRRFSGAVAALKLKSELSGHYVQRKETTVKHDPTDYSTDELVTWLANLEERFVREKDLEGMDAGSARH